MAFAVASKRAPLLAGLLKKLLLAAPTALALRPASVAAARRLFNTGGARFRRDDDDYEESSGDEDVFCDRRRCRRARDFSTPTFFSAGTRRAVPPVPFPPARFKSRREEDPF